MARVILNGQQVTVSESLWSYKEIARRVGLTNPTVTYRINGRGSTLGPTDSITPLDGMVINATDTSNA